MSVKPLCIVGVAGAILLFWSAWSWDGANVLGASPQGAAGRNADNPFAEPTFKKAAAADPADPFGDVAPASKGEKKAAAPAVVKKAAAKKAAAVPANWRERPSRRRQGVRIVPRRKRESKRRSIR